MAWSTIDPQTRQTVQAAGAPPGDVGAMLGDDPWLQLFTAWANDNAGREGDLGALHLAMWALAYNQAMPLEAMARMFVYDDGQFPCPWPENIPYLIESSGNINEDGVKTSMWGAATEILEPHYAVFVDDVAELQVVISGPQAVDIGRDQLDEAVIEGINQANLKAARNEGDTLQYWQADDILLIGTGHPASYYEWCNAQDGAAEGTITIVSRGGPLSTGKIEVTDCPDEDLFKRRLREFSKKKIDFVGGGDDEVEEEAAPVPATFDEAWASDQWYDTYVEWAHANFMGENVEFLSAVERYKAAQTREWARYIWDTFLQAGSPQQTTIDNDAVVQEIYDKLSDNMNPDDLGADLFDRAVGEVQGMLEGNYRLFQQAQAGG